MITAALSAAGLWVGLHLLLLVVFAVLVARQRGVAKVGIGDGGDKALHKAIRVHGNAVENAVPIAIGLVVSALMGAPVWLVHAFGAASFVGRIAHAIGITGSIGISAGRAIGMSLSWLTMIGLGVTLVILAVTRGVW